MTVMIAALSVIAFVIAFHFLRLVPAARGAIAVSQRTAGVMGDATLDDDAKEAAVRKASVDLLKSFCSIALRGIGTVIAAFIPIQLAGWAGLVPTATVLDFLMRIDVIIIASVLVIAAVWIGGKFWRN